MNKNPEDAQEEQELEFDYGKKYKNLPRIVIAGRPNVGKSTLFNRFLKKRRAITDPTPYRRTGLYKRQARFAYGYGRL